MCWHELLLGAEYFNKGASENKANHVHITFSSLNLRTKHSRAAGDFFFRQLMPTKPAARSDDGEMKSFNDFVG